MLKARGGAMLKARGYEREACRGEYEARGEERFVQTFWWCLGQGLGLLIWEGGHDPRYGDGEHDGSPPHIGYCGGREQQQTRKS